MSRVVVALWRAAVRVAPRDVRARYSEQWLADLGGAAEAGVSAWSIAAAALRVAILLRVRASRRRALVTACIGVIGLAACAAGVLRAASDAPTDLCPAAPRTLAVVPASVAGRPSDAAVEAAIGASVRAVRSLHAFEGAWVDHRNQVSIGIYGRVGRAPDSRCSPRSGRPVRR